MASKIANSGLSLSHIILTFKRDGQQGLENLLSEICENSKSESDQVKDDYSILISVHAFFRRVV